MFGYNCVGHITIAAIYYGDFVSHKYQVFNFFLLFERKIVMHLMQKRDECFKSIDVCVSNNTKVVEHSGSDLLEVYYDFKIF